MIDTSLLGVRCRAAQNIFRGQETVRFSSEGTIQYELESLGHLLINIRWDNGVCSLASPDDIEIVDTDVVWQ